MRLLFSLFLLLAGAAAADTTADLVQIEQKLTDALQRSDVDAVAALWADDLVWIGLSGKRRRRRRRPQDRRRLSSVSSIRTSRCGCTARRPS